MKKIVLVLCLLSLTACACHPAKIKFDVPESLMVAPQELKSIKDVQK